MSSCVGIGVCVCRGLGWGGFITYLVLSDLLFALTLVLRARVGDVLVRPLRGFACCCACGGAG